MKDMKLECLLLYSRTSWYTIVMIILSSWYFVFMNLFISFSNRKNAPIRFDQVYIHYLHNGVCQISMSDLMMNVHTCVTDNTTGTMLFVRPICQI